MHRITIQYSVLWFAIVLMIGVNGHVVRADTTINVEAILVNTSPSGQPRDDDTGDAKQSVGLDDVLWIKIDNKDLAREEAVLYLNGIAMKGNVAEGIVINGNSSWLKYRLKRNNREEWQPLLAQPKSFTKPVIVNIGKGKEKPSGKSAKIEFINVPETVFWLTTTLIVLLLIVFVVLARSTEIIRDRGPKADADQARTYSLAFTQMAFWTFIVASSYVFILIITGDLDTISGSTLVLMGIGTVTALSGASMDAGKRKTNDEKRLADKKKLEELKAKTPPPADEIQEIEDRITRQEKATKVLASGGFWDDILTDVDGAAIHRFQMVVWTIILGGIFLVKVHETLAMPQFSVELLSLMGISAGTYLGFKIPEKQTNSQP